MRKVFFRRLTATILFASLAVSALATTVIGERYDALRKQANVDSGVADGKRAVDLERMYRDMFSHLQSRGSLKEVKDDDLALLFRAAYLTASDSFNAQTIADMTMDLQELERRGKAAPVHYSQMYDMLVSARMFDAAREFYAKHASANLEPLPAIEEEAKSTRDSPSLLILQRDKQVLVHRDFAVAPSQILVVAHPLCHFSQYAVHDIEGNAFLKAVFKAHATWIAPPYGGLQVAAFSDWNQNHPDAPMGMAYRRSAWSMIDTWETPTFYFLRNGRVIAKVTGWPKTGNEAAIRAAWDNLVSSK